MGNMFLITCVEQWSLKERKQMKWVLWSLSVIPRESFQTRTQGGESQGEPSSVPELKRWTWEFGNIRVRSSQGRVKEKRELQWEISEDLQKHQPPPSTESSSEYQNIHMRKLPEAKGRITWKKQAEKSPGLSGTEIIGVLTSLSRKIIIREVSGRLFRRILAHLRGKIRPRPKASLVLLNKAQKQV